MGTNNKKTILIIDDHPLFREGLKSIIARDRRFDVIGEAGDARKGLAAVKRFQPDLAIVDISLPDKSGIEVARSIRSRHAGTRIVIVSMHARIDYVIQAFEAGATGYIVKESASDRLIPGLETVLQGDYFLDSSLSHAVVEKLLKAPLSKNRIEDSDYGSLTPREQEVMRLLAEGFAVREIAEKLYISPKTVENHRSNLMRKLGLHNAVELVRYAARLGLIDVDLWRD